MRFDRENEPDIGDNIFGNRSCDHDYGTSYYEGCYSSKPDESYRFSFRTREDLITSNIFQEMLTKALVFKDAEIASLRNELLNLRR